jgi:hypothetical protein
MRTAARIRIYGPVSGWETPSLYGRRGGDQGLLEIEKTFSALYPFFECRFPLEAPHWDRELSYDPGHLTNRAFNVCVKLVSDDLIYSVHPRP